MWGSYTLPYKITEGNVPVNRREVENKCSAFTRTKYVQTNGDLTKQPSGEDLRFCDIGDEHNVE